MCTHAAFRPAGCDPLRRVGPLLPGVTEVSPETQKLLDEEVRRIVGDARQQVMALLTDNRTRLALANALLAHETLDEEDAFAIAGVTRAQPTSTGALAAAARSTT